MLRETRAKAKLDSRRAARPRASAEPAPGLDAYLGHLLDLAHRRVVADLDRVLAPQGVQRDEWRVLQVLRDEQGRSMGELAQAVAMNHPTLTKLIDRMVGKSWVQRNIDTADSRRVLVFVTDIGLHLTEQLQQPVAAHLHALDHSLGRGGARALRDMLATLIEAEAGGSRG